MGSAPIMSYYTIPFLRFVWSGIIHIDISNNWMSDDNIVIIIRKCEWNAFSGMTLNAVMAVADAHMFALLICNGKRCDLSGQFIRRKGGRDLFRLYDLSAIRQPLLQHRVVIFAKIRDNSARFRNLWPLPPPFFRPRPKLIAQFIKIILPIVVPVSSPAWSGLLRHRMFISAHTFYPCKFLQENSLEFHFIHFGSFSPKSLWTVLSSGLFRIP